MPNKNTNVEEIEQSSPRKRYINKKHLQGFLAGILVCVITFSGIYFGTNGRFFTGTMSDQLENVTDENFNSVVLNSDRPVLVVVTTDWDSSDLNKTNIIAATEFLAEHSDYCKVVTMDADLSAHTMNDYNIYEPHMLLLFRDGQEVMSKSFIRSADDLVKWLDFNTYSWQNYSSSKNQSLAAAPTIYNMFPSDSIRDHSEYYPANIVGEYRLFAFTTTDDNYDACNGQTVSGRKSMYFDFFFPNNYDTSKPDSSFMLPDLTNTVPAQGLNYYICTNGAFPDIDIRSDYVPSYTSNGIKYFKHENTPVDGLYVGEIRLESDVDESKYGELMIPCDGRELNTNDYIGLFDRIGNTFGGDGKTTFCVPDLSGKSPVEGAQYYIMSEGMYLN